MIKTEKEIQDKPRIEKGGCKMGKKLVAYYSRADENYTCLEWEMQTLHLRSILLEIPF